MSNEKEIKDYTGLSTVSSEAAAKGVNRQDKEIDLTTALLKAAEFKVSEDLITEVKIKRGGEYLFSVHLHPISDSDRRKAAKQATKYISNPNGKKLPKIEGDFDAAKFNSLLIYMATIPEDQKKIWANKEIKEKYDLIQCKICNDRIPESV